VTGPAEGRARTPERIGPRIPSTSPTLEGS
jgi:hypothetical protein